MSQAGRKVSTLLASGGRFGGEGSLVYGLIV